MCMILSISPRCDIGIFICNIFYPLTLRSIELKRVALNLVVSQVPPHKASLLAESQGAISLVSGLKLAP